MHSLNIDAALKHSLLEVAPPTGGGTSTPYSLNTPDILNTLMSITTNPFFDNASSSDSPSDNLGSDAQAGGDEDRKVFATLEAPSASGPSPSTPNTPSSIIVSPSQPSTVQSLRSQFIKDSLKLTIQTKRKTSGKVDLDLTEELEPKVKRREELTPEDEERRKRRRERNKVAATKCRNKKKQKTGLLVQESESLCANNISMKSEISKLEDERIRLTEILAAHAPVCTMKLGSSNPSSVITSANNNSVLPSYGGEYNSVIHTINPNNNSNLNSIYYRQQQLQQQTIH